MDFHLQGQVVALSGVLSEQSSDGSYVAKCYLFQYRLVLADIEDRQFLSKRMVLNLREVCSQLLHIQLCKH